MQLKLYTDGCYLIILKSGWIVYPGGLFYFLILLGFFSNIATEQMLYSEADLEASMDKIETINFHEEKEIMGVKFWAYNAGHVLGAAMFMIEIAGVKVRR